MDYTHEDPHCLKCKSKDLEAEFLEFVQAKNDTNFVWDHLIDERAAAVEGYPFAINLSVRCKTCGFVTLEPIMNEEVCKDFGYKWGEDHDGIFIEVDMKEIYSFMPYHKMKLYLDTKWKDIDEDILNRVNDIIAQLKSSSVPKTETKKEK